MIEQESIWRINSRRCTNVIDFIWTIASHLMQLILVICSGNSGKDLQLEFQIVFVVILHGLDDPTVA